MNRAPTQQPPLVLNQSPPGLALIISFLTPYSVVLIEVSLVDDGDTFRFSCLHLLLVLVPSTVGHTTAHNHLSLFKNGFIEFLFFIK